MSCECITAMDEHLKEHNARVVTTLTIRPMTLRVHLQTEKIVPRKPHKGVLATFCPFCGVKYDGDAP